MTRLQQPRPKTCRDTSPLCPILGGRHTGAIHRLKRAEMKLIGALRIAGAAVNFSLKLFVAWSDKLTGPPASLWIIGARHATIGAQRSMRRLAS